MKRITATIGIIVVGLAFVSSRVAAQTAGSTQGTPAPAAPATQALNLNSATQAQLERLPGIGPATAARILEYRQKNGGFKRIEDLMSIRGVGEKTFLRLKSLVTVTPAKTLEAFATRTGLA